MNALSSRGPQLTALFDNLGQPQLGRLALHGDLPGVRQRPGGREHRARLGQRRHRFGAAEPTDGARIASHSSSGRTGRLSVIASPTSTPSPAPSPPNSGSLPRSSGTSRWPSTTSRNAVRPERSGRPRPAVAARPDGRLGRVLEVGLRQRPVAARCSSQSIGPRTRIPTIDLGCGVNGLLAALPTPPGASSGPDLSIRALVGGQR